jgi:hypothetical protein
LNSTKSVSFSAPICRMSSGVTSPSARFLMASQVMTGFGGKDREVCGALIFIPAGAVQSRRRRPVIGTSRKWFRRRAIGQSRERGPTWRPVASVPLHAGTDPDLSHERGCPGAGPGRSDACFSRVAIVLATEPRGLPSWQRHSEAGAAARAEAAVARPGRARLDVCDSPSAPGLLDRPFRATTIRILRKHGTYPGSLRP